MSRPIRAHVVASDHWGPAPGVEASSSLHHDPPVRPRSLGPPRVAVLIALGFVAFAVAAGYGDGEALRHIDDPIVSWVENIRTPWLTRLMEAISRFGGNTLVFCAAGLLALAACWRCRPTAMMILVIVVSRPALEWLIKEITDRERPGHALMETTGDSFPSGHVLAAMLLWALLPPLVTCFTNRRDIWWCSIGVSAAAVVGVAASRVYLGVHWPTDVAASFVLGIVLLYLADRLRDGLHRHLRCQPPHPDTRT